MFFSQHEDQTAQRSLLSSRFLGLKVINIKIMSLKILVIGLKMAVIVCNYCFFLMAHKPEMSGTT